MTPDQIGFLIFIAKGTLYYVSAFMILLLGLAIFFILLFTIIMFGLGYCSYLSEVNIKAKFQKLFSNMWWTGSVHAIRSLLRKLVPHRTLFIHESDLSVPTFQGKQISQCGYEQIKNHVQHTYNIFTATKRKYAHEKYKYAYIEASVRKNHIVCKLKYAKTYTSLMFTTLTDPSKCYYIINRDEHTSFDPKHVYRGVRGIFLYSLKTYYALKDEWMKIKQDMRAHEIDTDALSVDDLVRVYSLKELVRKLQVLKCDEFVAIMFKVEGDRNLPHDSLDLKYIFRDIEEYDPVKHNIFGVYFNKTRSTYTFHDIQTSALLVGDPYYYRTIRDLANEIFTSTKEEEN